MMDDSKVVLVDGTMSMVGGKRFVARVPYWLFDERPSLSWQVLLRQNDNLSTCEPVFRKSWHDGGLVEIFTLLPPDDPDFKFHCDMLLHIRIYTKANSRQSKPGVRSPNITVQSAFPVFTYTEPKVKRLSVTLLI